MKNNNTLSYKIVRQDQTAQDSQGGKGQVNSGFSPIHPSVTIWEGLCFGRAALRIKICAVDCRWGWLGRRQRDGFLLLPLGLALVGV